MKLLNWRLLLPVHDVPFCNRCPSFGTKGRNFLRPFLSIVGVTHPLPAGAEKFPPRHWRYLMSLIFPHGNFHHGYCRIVITFRRIVHDRCHETSAWIKFSARKLSLWRPLSCRQLVLHQYLDDNVYMRFVPRSSETQVPSNTRFLAEVERDKQTWTPESTRSLKCTRKFLTETTLPTHF